MGSCAYIYRSATDGIKLQSYPTDQKLSACRMNNTTSGVYIARTRNWERGNSLHSNSGLDAFPSASIFTLAGGNDKKFRNSTRLFISNFIMSPFFYCPRGCTVKVWNENCQDFWYNLQLNRNLSYSENSRAFLLFHYIEFNGKLIILLIKFYEQAQL